MPELFSGRALAQFYDKRRRDELEAVQHFDGLMADEPDALVGSFAAEPELHDPVRGRVKGKRAFDTFVTGPRPQRCGVLWMDLSSPPNALKRAMTGGRAIANLAASKRQATSEDVA
jgi:hypothetical protein